MSKSEKMSRSDLRSRFEAARKAADEAYVKLNRELAKCERALDSLKINRDIWHCFREEPGTRHYIGWAQHVGKWRLCADHVDDKNPDANNIVAVLDASLPVRQTAMKHFPALLEKCTATAEKIIEDVEQSISDSEAARKYLLDSE